MILGASILQLPAIIKARELGLYVIAVDIDPKAVGFKYSDESLLISTIDTERVVKSAYEKKIHGIMTLATDMPMKTVAATAKKLNLPSISVETAEWTTNKYMMRERLALGNIPIPEYYKITDLNEFRLISNHFVSPFIVKPADNSGSRGVFLVRSKSEVEAAYYHAKKYSRNGEIIMEEFMKGNEVSVETISINGQVHILAITDKLTTGPPFFVEMGHSQPAEFDFPVLEKIKEIARNAILTLGITDGPSHTEIIVTENGPKIVEIGARLGGDNITSHLVPLSTGINMVEACIKLAIGDKPDLNAKFIKSSAIRYFNTSPGQIQSINGIKEAMQVNGINEITFTKKEGDVIGEIQSSTDRIGFVIASGNTPQEPIDACKKAVGMIKISIAPCN